MRVVCYARTSTIDQARPEKVSIPDQIKWAKQLASDKNWEWVGEYIEPGVFGDVEMEQRDRMNEMWNDAKSGLFDLVLIYHSSRFAREPDIGMRICRLLGQHKIQTYFGNSPIEPVSPDKFIWGANIGAIYMIAFSFVGDFQENLARSDRVRSGFRGLAQKGKMPFTPYGYRKIPEMKVNEYGRQIYDWHFELEPKEASIVQGIFTDYVEKNGSIRQIMLKLNADNTPSPSGKTGLEAWSTATVKNILNNPAYIQKVRWGRKLGGKFLQGKTSTGKQKRVFTPPEKWILVKGDRPHPRIIDDDLFNKVQEKLKIRSVLRGRAVASKGLLTGLIYCGRCNRKSYHKTSVYKRKKNYTRSNYVCQSYFRHKSCKRHVIAANKIHDIVIGEIEKITTNPTYRERLLVDKYKDKVVGLKKRLELLEKGREKVEAKRERDQVAFENDILTLETFGKAIDRLNNEDLEIMREISKIEKILSDSSSAETAKKKFLSVLSNFKKEFDKADFSKRKDLFQLLFQSVIVNGNKITFNYRI